MPYNCPPYGIWLANALEAVKFIRANAGTYGWDAKAIFVLGDRLVGALPLGSQLGRAGIKVGFPQPIQSLPLRRLP
jgi:hypothetical protein